MSTPPFKVGDKVRLNNHGIYQIHGLSNQEEAKAQQDGFFVTKVEESIEGGWFHIEVDGPLGKYLMTDSYLERVIDLDTSIRHITLRGQMDYPLHAWACTKWGYPPTTTAFALVEHNTLGEAKDFLDSNYPEHKR